MRALGLTAGLVVAGAAGAQSVESTMAPEVVDFSKMLRVTEIAGDEAEPLLRGAQRGGPPFTCPTGGSQQDFVNNGSIVGFGRCGIFNPVDNFIPTSNSNLNEMCFRGLQLQLVAGSPNCAPALDSAANVGWNVKIWGGDANGLPSTVLAEFENQGVLQNLTIQRFQFGETWGNGARPLWTWHASFGRISGGFDMNPALNGIDLTGGTCYWLGICWDSAVGGNPAGCDFRWLNGVGGDGFVFFEDNPADGTYEECNLIANFGDMDWVLNVATTPTVADPSNCLMGSLTTPVNDTCIGVITLACDSMNNFCIVLANPDVDSLVDPPISCLIGGTGADYISYTTWYKVVVPGEELLIDACNADDGWGNVIAVYRPTPGHTDTDFCNSMALNGQAGTVPMEEIACADDICGGDAFLCLTGLTPGETLYFIAGSDDNLNNGDLTLNITCTNIPRPANDECETAQQLTIGIFGSVTVAGQDTSCATLDPFAIACGGTANGNSPGIWYRISSGDNVNARTMTASTCNISGCGAAAFDTQINVYCGTCGCGLVCVAGNDDDCDVQSTVTWCARPGQQYYIYVHGFFARGCFALEVIRGANCDASGEPMCVNTTTCTVDTSGANHIEAEDCGDATNSSCATAEHVDCGDIIAGKSWAQDNFRDLDSYHFTITERSLVTISLEAEFNNTLFFLSSNDCATNVVIAAPQAGPCEVNEVSVVLNPGGYQFTVSINNFNGFPCGCQNDYVVSINCDPFGACCDGSDCYITNSANCEGDFQGAGTDCGTITYNRNEACADTFATIATNPSATQVILDLVDAEFVDLCFDFDYFTERKDSVAITSKGYLSFDNIVLITGTPATAFPDAAEPNDIVAPFWANLDPQNSGEVWYLCDAGSSTFVAQFNGVGRFSGGGPQGANNFQVKLLGATGCVRFVYGSISPAPTSANTAAGIENSLGTVGSGVTDVANLGGSVTCVEFCPDAINDGPCDQGCDGDADGNGIVDTGDITFIVLRLGNMPGPCGDGDVDGNGVVNTGDISYVVLRLGTCNPGGPCN